ncbi:large-conductance mechanosensitive channel [Rhodococcus sp. SORGH_AS 301]|nr:large-conductance mechanosensitive channel [Rhodococcus sp. SORGH_AS_0301]
MNIGAVITAVINFVIIAAVVYFVLILPVNTAKNRFATKKEKALSDQDILIQIRDLLAEGRSDGVKTTSDGITGNTTPGTTTT